MPFFPAQPSAYLVLRDGSVYPGEAFGAFGASQGEVVFTTNMTGYQEVLTDPSYKGQIVTMTMPLIGNYGIHDTASESPGIKAEGFIVTEACRRPSHHASQMTLDRYLKNAGVPGIFGIDTRALTRKLRSAGVMPGILTTEADADLEALKAAAAALPVEPDASLVASVSVGAGRLSGQQGEGPRIVALDYGIKQSILRYLVEAGFQVELLPATATAAEVMERKPDGLFLSNGPGDPALLGPMVEELRQLLPKVPTFGICLGHQLLGQAFGATTFKLPFGHRGGNHPILEVDTGRIAITTQNHGYALDEDSLEAAGLRVTHRNLNDQTVAGVAHKELPCFSVQHHPEAAPGPHDARYLIQRFKEMLDAQKN